jgi:hypothetical protein
VTALTYDGLRRHVDEMNAGRLCEDCVHRMHEPGIVGKPGGSPCERCGAPSEQTAVALVPASDRDGLLVMCRGCCYLRVGYADSVPEEAWS